MKQTWRAALKKGIGERDPVGVELRDEVMDDIARLPRPGFGAWEEGRRVPIRDPCQAAGDRAGSGARRSGRRAGRGGRHIRRRPPRGGSSPWMRKIFPGGDGNGVEQRMACHQVIALLIVGRHATLVAKSNLDAVPGRSPAVAAHWLVNRRQASAPRKVRRGRRRAQQWQSRAL